MAPGGLLLIVTHESVAPWSWNQDPHQRFPAPRESLDALELPARQWTIEIAEVRERRAVGPEGRAATVSDLVIAARRRGA